MADFHSSKNALYVEDRCSCPTRLQCEDTASVEQILIVFLFLKKELSYMKWSTVSLESLQHNHTMNSNQSVIQAVVVGVQ